MAKAFAKQFYNSSRWKRCRQAYIDERITIDGGMCEKCHDRLGYIVHHKQEITPENIIDDNITLSFNNLRYDCKRCHDEEDNHFIKSVKQSCGFDENGNPVPL